MEWKDDSWTNYDQQAWEGLLGSEPFSSKSKSQNRNEKENMLNIQNRQVPTGNEVTPKGITFLSPRHVTKEGIVAKVIGCTNAESTPPTGKRDNYNNPVVVRWTFNGQKYEKGFKLTSDNLAAQARILGNDETKWAGQSILIAKTLGDEGDERLAFLPVPKGKK